MKTKLTRSIIFLAVFVVSFGIGYWIGTWKLAKCQARNKILADDLIIAVGQGIITEANLQLCKERKK